MSEDLQGMQDSKGSQELKGSQGLQEVKGPQGLQEAKGPARARPKRGARAGGSKAAKALERLAAMEELRLQALGLRR